MIRGMVPPWAYWTIVVVTMAGCSWLGWWWHGVVERWVDGPITRATERLARRIQGGGDRG